MKFPLRLKRNKLFLSPDDKTPKTVIYTGRRKSLFLSKDYVRNKKKW